MTGSYQHLLKTEASFLKVRDYLKWNIDCAELNY